MSGLFRFYDPFFHNLGGGVFTFPSDSLKMVLLNSTYTPCSSFGTRDGLLNYTAGDVIFSAAYNCYFVASVGGLSALGSPLFDVTPGAATEDGSVTWVSCGLAPPSAHAVLADIVAHEIVATGYTPGGATVSYSHTLEGRRAVLAVAEANWPGSTITAKYGALHKVGTAGGKVNPLVGYVLLDSAGGVMSGTAGDFRVRFGNGKVYTLGGW